jgi:small subunit ribosomal protein S19
MSNRSVWKGPFVDSKLLKKVNDKIESGKLTPIKTWSRKSTVLPNFVGLTFAVHNGKKFIPVLINEKMVGKKLGEFSSTRSFTSHGNNKR